MPRALTSSCKALPLAVALGSGPVTASMLAHDAARRNRKGLRVAAESSFFAGRQR